MSVQSRPIPRAKESAIASRATLRKQRGAIERYTAWIILLVSFLGTIAALAGGWPPLIAACLAFNPPWAAIAGGFAIQAALTFLEWWYYDLRLISYPARIVDSVFTALGYGPLVLVPLGAALLARGVENAVWGAWAIIGVVSYLLAWYPESRLID